MARIAVAGTWLFHGYASKPKPSVSTPAQLHKEFTPALPAFFSLNRQRLEVLPSKSLQTSLIRCYDTNKAASAKSEENATPNKGYFRSIIAEAAAGITPAVVHLYAQQGQDEKFGSGAVIHEDGYILTCSHIFFDKTNMIHSSNGKVLVRLQKPKEDVVGQESKKDVVGQVVDAYVDLDIAIIKIDPPSSSLSTAKVGSSSELRPGDWAIAMGSPLCLPNTITLGIFSHVCRTSKDISDGGMHVEYLQTDCAINPGNSGGPLCNVDGELVGVNIEELQKASGVSFAVPVDFISAIIKPFQNFQSPLRPDFGWVVRNFSKNSEALAKNYSKFRYGNEGVFVQRVIKGSPANRAGIQDRDVIVEFNGKRVRDITEMMNAMGERSGKPVEVLVKRARDGRDDSVRLTITFQEKPVSRL
ncbi:putative protease Do-like 14 [Eucalyptus grandis]|uniref:putative protease Do-like 14 n=1 Tax=Eucalyptus grandis TaxID=71139 RepID=UPI00192E88E3|nr:putative protease Do-like 14 [Eucalyptus grandis]